MKKSPANKRTEAASVREPAAAGVGPQSGTVIRLQCRLDYYVQTQRIDASIVAWEHPIARVVFNELWQNVGPLMWESLYVDVAHGISSALGGGEELLQQSFSAQRVQDYLDALKAARRKD